jgi:hypothetical protein
MSTQQYSLYICTLNRLEFTTSHVRQDSMVAPVPPGSRPGDASTAGHGSRGRYTSRHAKAKPSAPAPDRRGAVVMMMMRRRRRRRRMMMMMIMMLDDISRKEGLVNTLIPARLPTAAMT